jgi:histidine triad (HIT) family protein
VKPDCLFCRIVARQVPGDIVYEDDDVLAFNDINPQAPTHVLIIPKEHVATVNDVADADAAVFSTLVLRARAASGPAGNRGAGLSTVAQLQRRRWSNRISPAPASARRPSTERARLMAAPSFSISR